eukprot:3538740-Rhodomonas_salina.1
MSCDIFTVACAECELELRWLRAAVRVDQSARDVRRFRTVVLGSSRGARVSEVVGEVLRSAVAAEHAAAADEEEHAYQNSPG